MLIGRIQHKNRIFPVLYDPEEKRVFEIYCSIKNVLKSVDEEVDVSTEGISIKEVSYLIPVKPSKIICLGRNYRDHAKELGNVIPEYPLLFFKPPSCLLPHQGNVRYPEFSRRVDYEGELALVIKTKIKNINSDELSKDSQRYFGYTSFLDMTARDIQNSDEQWTRAKGFDTSGPIGPWININPLPNTLRIITRVNDEIKQDSSTKKMIFNPFQIIEYISRFMTLETGDVISTGTPEGIGEVKVGDTIRLEIESLEPLQVYIKD